MKFNTRTEAGRKAQAEYLANPFGYRGSLAGMKIPDLFNLDNTVTLSNLPTLPTGPLPVIEPFEPELPTQVGGIGSILPSRTITLPGGQTVQIPEINMDEVNANLAAANITPQMPTQTFVSDTQGLPLPPPSGSTLPFDPIKGREHVDMGASPPAVTTPLPNPMLDPNVSIPTKPPQTTSVPGTTSPSPGAEVLPAPVAPPAYTPPPAPREDMPFVPSVRQVATGLDPLTEQLLFGIGGEGGFIPGAMRAAEKTFFDEEGKPIVIEEQVAGFTPDQLRAAELARQGVGVQDRFIEGAEGAFGRGIGALGEGFGRARGFAGQGLEATRAGLGDLTSGLSEQERISRGATGQFGQRLGGLGRQAMRSTTDFGGRLGESERLLRGTTGAYDPSLTSAFYNPFEDRVVQQTIDDVLERGAQTDIAARAGDIARGGESAFGSRARLGASERQEALGRGLGEAISGIRARGFSEAQQTGLSEFARQRAAERAASSGLAGLSASRLGAQQQLGSTLRGLSADQLAAQQGLAGTLGTLGAQRFGGQQALAGALTGLGGMESQLAQREQAAQFGLGSALQGLGSQAQGAQAADIASLYGMGTQQQAFNQAQLDAQRRNQLQAQQAPLAQFQALAPFVSMAPAGQFQTVTDFAPPPSPLQAGLGVGLSTFGALGNLYGGQG
tara:strand:- start:248 stop:2260 length:2013 start_codon:yes stop_codon:yes gene_type:complete